eukprot:jgi/Undpi1/6571/HiC_scaffold_20.g09050.m1
MSRDGQPLGKLPSVKGVKPIVPRQHLGSLASVKETSPDETAAVLIEPVLGEGGYVVPPPGFMAGVRAFCDRHNILLIADEVQSGAGRTGEWWAVNHDDVIPDLLVFAKGIGSGMPISGVATRSELTARQVGAFLLNCPLQQQ